MACCFWSFGVSANSFWSMGRTAALKISRETLLFFIGESRACWVAKRERGRSVAGCCSAQPKARGDAGQHEGELPDVYVGPDVTGNVPMTGVVKVSGESAPGLGRTRSLASRLDGRAFVCRAPRRRRADLWPRTSCLVD